MMYDVPTNGCNLEIMGYPFYIDSVSANEAIRRREYNFNNLIGGTQKVTKGAYVGLDFSVTTFVKVDPQRPDMHNTIFQKMMAQPVRVNSPDLGGGFMANVTIKPERHTPSYLKLTIAIKEIPDRDSHIPGEKFTVPAPKKVTVKKSLKQSVAEDAKKAIESVWGTSKTKKKTSNKKKVTKKKTVTKKTKSKAKNKKQEDDDVQFGV